MHYNRGVFEILALAIGYAVIGLIVSSFAPSGGENAAGVWPLTGIALAALLLRGVYLWPGVLAGSLLLNAPILISSAGDFRWELLPIFLTVALGATLSALAGYWGLRRYFPRGQAAFVDSKTVVVFFLVAMATATINASTGSIGAAFAEGSTGSEFGWTWFIRYLADLVAIVIWTPFILSWAKPLRHSASGRRTEAVAIFGILLVMANFVFFGWGMPGAPFMGVGAYLMLPILAWIAMRFGVRGASTALVLVHVFSVWATFSGRGPFVIGNSEPVHYMFLLGLYTTVIAAMSLMLSGLQNNQRAAQLLLQKIREDLATNVEAHSQASAANMVVRTRELKESEARYRRMVETSEEGILTLNDKGVIDFANSHMAKMLAYSVEELCGKHFLELLETKNHGEGMTHFEKSKAGARQQYDVKLRRKDGGLNWVIISTSPLFDDTGKFYGVLKMVTDITERNLFAEKLASSLSVLHATLEATADGILVVDPSGKIVKYNQKFLTMWHVPLDIVKSGNDEALLAYVLSQLSDPQQFIAKAQLYFGKETDDFDVLNFRDGRIFERVSKAHMIGSNEMGRVWSFRDVTERDRLDRERYSLLESERKSRESAERAVHSREEFLSVASHELKTPITSLSFAVQNIEQMLEGQEAIVPVRFALEVAERQTKRLTNLVNQLLDISRMQSGYLRLEPERTDLKNMVNVVLEELRDEIARSGCQISVEAANGVIGMWDPGRIEQVITNLVTNALKYGAGKKVSITVRRKLDNGILCIEDRGPGIENQYLDRIFEPFERAAADRTISGLGLGLAIVKNIVGAHGGKIEVHSKIGTGSIFLVTLPMWLAAH